jgi:hypothetical protein
MMNAEPENQGAGTVNRVYDANALNTGPENQGVNTINQVYDSKTNDTWDTIKVGMQKGAEDVKNGALSAYETLHGKEETQRVKPDAELETQRVKNNLEMVAQDNREGARIVYNKIKEGAENLGESIKHVFTSGDSDSSSTSNATSSLPPQSAHEE